jgi:hypothetical protein
MSRTCVAIAMGLLASRLALATDHPEEARRLVLRETSSGRASLTWLARIPAPALPATSPTTVDALLVVVAKNQVATLPLPASGWSTNAAGTVYKYKNAAAPGGPSVVKAVLLRDQKVVKVGAKGPSISLDDPMQGTVSISLHIGSDTYCSVCTTPERDEPGRYVATRCPAPASCPGGTTSTTTTTTTSTTIGPVCGDGVVDQASEECDGMDPGHCLDVEPPFPIACEAPGSPNECTCCGISQCMISPGSVSPCCGGAICQDATGAGDVRGGVCLPPTCTQTADCNGGGYDCVGGTCCAMPGSICDPTACCPGSGGSCEPYGGGSRCCLAAGAGCTIGFECCSFSCTGNVCD